MAKDDIPWFADEGKPHPLAHPPSAKLAFQPKPARRKPGKAAFTPADDEKANREDNGKHTEDCQTVTEDNFLHREADILAENDLPQAANDLPHEENHLPQAADHLS